MRMNKQLRVSEAARNGSSRSPVGRRGVTYLEYAMLAALVGIVVAVGAMRYGQSLLKLFDALGDKTAEVVPKKGT